MERHSGVRIRQYNDPEILEFFNKHGVQYRLLGDHLFVIRSGGRDLAAGPGDRLSIAADGQVQIQHGDYASRARRALERARQARIRRQLRLRAPDGGDPERRSASPGGPTAQMPVKVPESETDRWKRRVEAEARERLKRNIRHVAQKG